MVEDMRPEDFTLRSYQSQILDISVKKNTIVYLPTGAGKTYIAIMLINRLSNDLILPNTKKSVVLVNTIPLVEQHYKTIKSHTNFKVGYFSGEQNVDYWLKDQWLHQLRKYQVIVITSQIFLDLLRHGYFSLKKVNLLIFDECHQAISDQPMRQIMQLFQNIPDKHQPRVLGLTATLLNGNCSPDKVAEVIAHLETTFHGTVATVQTLSQILGFSTKPQEKIIYFDPPGMDDVITKSLNTLHTLKKFISGLKLNSKKKLSNQENESKSLIKLLDALCWHINTCGVFGASKAALACIIQVERMKRHAEDSFFYNIMAVVITTLTLILKVLEDFMIGNDLPKRIFLFSSPHILTLLQIIREYKLQTSDICGIIFVKQRFTAKIIYYILKALSETDPEFSFIRTDYMVGFSSGSSERDTKEIFYSAKINKKIVSRFQNNEINILVASSVVEEGFDIRRCTLVVKFDRPTDYRSYIQSKGRARHDDSQYFILVPCEEKLNYLKTYNNFQIVEQLLQKILIGKTDQRKVPSLSTIKEKLYEDQDVPPYYVDGVDSPHVSAVSSIPLLNRYCLSLHRDKYVQLVPDWSMEQELDGLTTKFTAIIEMPVICPLRDPIRGCPMLSKVAARRSAALEACKQLHQIKELTDHLLPKNETEDELDFEYLFKHWIKKPMTDYFDGVTPKPGSKKSIRLYKLSIPKILLKPKSNIYYLHPIIITPKIPLNQFHDLICSDLNYAILTRSVLPSFCKFPIFVSAGELEISIQVNYKELILNNDELSYVMKFNHFIFSKLLHIVQQFLIYDNEEQTGFMIIVPIRNKVQNTGTGELSVSYEIDEDVLHEYTIFIPVTEPSKEAKMELNVTKDLYRGKIICPWYRSCDPYIVLEVSDNLNALSLWQNENYESYENYYQKKYNITIVNPTQPLLYVKGISRRLNCIQPRSASLHFSGKRKKQNGIMEDYEEHLIPELCVLQKFPGTLWYKAQCIPTILYRVVGLLQAEELRQQIVTETGIGKINHVDYRQWRSMPVDSQILCTNKKKRPPINTQTNPSPSTSADNFFDIERNIDDVTGPLIDAYDKYFSEEFTSDSDKVLNLSREQLKFLSLDTDVKPITMLSGNYLHLGPEQWEIFQCLSSSKANEIVNFERLETLGDSFLKISTTLFLFLYYPNLTEGRLTNIKGKMIGNCNLFYCGLQKNLAGYIKVTEFTPSIEWLPPLHCIPKLVRDHIERKSMSVNKLFKFTISVNEQLSGELSNQTIEKFNKLVEESEEDDLTHTDCLMSMKKFLGYQNVQDKTIADCVEALIGSCLHSNGVTGGLAMIEWFNIIPSSKNPKDLFYHVPPSPLLHSGITIEEIDFHIPNYEELEKNLGYTFQNRAFLLQALTHASYTMNRLTDCYQRLEFLGDAVLDFLITSHIYEISNKLTPGQLTDLRSSLVNNVTFAALTVRNGFHKHLKYMSTKLLDVIDTFVKFQEKKGFKINEEALFLAEEHPKYIAENIHVPKVLGDLFESLAGAVFLDSGLDLQITWQVFYSLMRQEIETFRWNIPISPVRMLYENVKAVVRFEKSKFINHNVSVVTCSLLVNGKQCDVHGFGENKYQAKCAAAKLALRLLQIKKN